MSYKVNCLGCKDRFSISDMEVTLMVGSLSTEFMCNDCYRSMKEFFEADNAHLLGFWTEKANKELGAIEKANKEYSMQRDAEQSKHDQSEYQRTGIQH